MSWEFLTRQVVEALHAEQLRRHGGAYGVRDENALESALARPEYKAAYGIPDHADLAAAYLFGLARNHAFVDGNKRIGLVAAGAFLVLNGYDLKVNEGAMYELVMSVAAGEVEEQAIARFFRDHTEQAGA